MLPRSTGLFFVLAGAALIAIGILVASGGLSWFGRLPGDVRIEREHVRVYVPITSMVIVSLALTAIGWVVRRLM